jgi:glycosyltransferase involved in cell wall biosynthesis
MILIDALYINDGGGKVLLDYLIAKLEEQNIVCFYLLDDRIKNNGYKIKSSNKVVYVKATLLNRFLFYKKNIFFTTVFCLGNLPPNIRLNSKVITYFHSQLYIKTSDETSIVEKLKYILKRSILRFFSKNTDFWFVQTESIKESLNIKFKIDNAKIKLMPFYPPFEKTKDLLERMDYTYLYVSNATAHKNHPRLIEAFCLFYDKYKIGNLSLTVGDEYKVVRNLITQKKQEGYPINNVGFVGREELQKMYLSCQFLVFPSLSESFGLGIIEAIENGCKVIGADLSYTYSVCKPSITFEPTSVVSIFESFVKSLDVNIAVSESHVSNKIDDIVKFIK